MSKEKRYTLDFCGHIYARNDTEAKFLSAKIKEIIENEIENIQNVSITELTLTPFGTFHQKTIHKGDISIFEHKLLLQ